jgi:N-acyl-L-homoserine lactone synthetase
MKTLKIFKAKTSSGEIKEIEFGHPTNQAEMKEMFRFRYKTYLKHGYIEADYFKDGLDCDEYDKDGKAVYFIAKTEGRLIGSVRLIIDNILPTEKDCFDFQEPVAMKNIARNQRGEVSRLIVEKLGKDKYFPRHLVMLGLISCLIDYAKSNNLDGGYGFIKDKLKKKLEKIKIPLVIINNFKQKYSQELLYGYFHNKKDPVWPIYYIVKDLNIYINKIFDIYFSHQGDNIYEYKGSSMMRNIIFYLKTK